MFPLSNCLFLFFNFIALLSGWFAIGSSWYLQTHGITECQKVIHNQLLVMGIILVAMALLGLIGTFCKATFLLWIYTFVAFLVLVGLTAFAVLVYAVKNPSATEGLSGIGFKECRLDDYSQWMQNMVTKSKNWKSIRACLIKHQVCKSLENNVDQMAEEFYKKKLSSIESGCCKPPIQCGLEYKNATYWVVPKPGLAAKDHDCTTWSNDQDKLCYDCDSCKAGVIDMSRIPWKIFFILDIIDIAIVVIIFALSWCTRMNILSDKKYNRGDP